MIIFSDELRNEIANKYVEGVSIIDLSYEYYYSTQVIRRELIKANVFVPHRKWAPIKYDDEFIKRELANGKTIIEISNEIGLKHQTLIHHCKVNGIDFKQKKKKSIAEMAEENGIKPVTVYQRLRYGWSITKALTTPVDTNKRHNPYEV